MKGTLRVDGVEHSVEYIKTNVPTRGKTVSGYGSHMPTRYMVLWEGRWRRVYESRCANVGTCFIGQPGSWKGIFSI